MRQTKTPSIGQGVLFDAELDVRIETQRAELLELSRRNPRVAFGRAVMPYFFGQDPRDYTDITEEMVQATSPDRMEPYLFGSGSRYSVDGVVLDSYEFEHVVRSPEAFSSSVMNRTYKARGLDHNPGRRIDTARRSGSQALDTKLDRMQKTLRGIRGERREVGQLQDLVHTPGYANARFRTMQSLVSGARYLYFGRILGVVGREKEWDKDKADLASRSLDVRLLWGGDEGLGSRVKHWREWLELEEEYARQRDQLFTNRIGRVAGLLGVTVESV